MPKATQLVSSKARIQTQLFKPVLPLNHYGGTRHQALGILVFRTHQNINNVGSEVEREERGDSWRGSSPACGRLFPRMAWGTSGKLVDGLSDAVQSLLE